MNYIGIDPGLEGAVALLCGQSNPEFFDAPTVILKSGKSKKRKYNVPEMVRFLAATCLGSDCFVGLESVHAMPGQGVTSMFSMGHGLGLWEGILTAMHLPFEFVPPQRWKKSLMDGQPKEKDSSRVVAMRLFPSAIPDLSLKKHHGRADALLIAEYIRRKQGSG